MSVRIRLARHGRKGYAFYHIVVANSKAPRDGKFIEKIGSYNPNTNPATVLLDMDKSIKWLQNGAQPTDVVRSIFSKEGVLLKKHLLEGVKKGAFDEAKAEEKFNAWKNEKAKKAEAKKSADNNAKVAAAKARQEAESKVNSDRAEAIAKKKAEEAAAKAEAEAAAAAPADEAVAEAPAAE
ncbi:MAG: 30S ribosomal protein S16 [Marinilabiliaceae bacterium]|nr:30S ribosomal protein S16 [Marinilabiliaceae bacterium]